MSENRQRIDKFHLKGNASFTIREGWLTKGLRNVRNDPEVFLREDATVRLGIGSAMVKSLRFWLQAAGLTTEPKAGRRVQAVTDLGNLIMEKDTYFEDPFTLFLVHSHIATNPHLTTVWYLLFNYFTAQRFTREMMEESLLATFRELTSEEFALSSFKDDCAVALKTYVDDQSRQATPEDNMLCPLASLGLFRKTARDLRLPVNQDLNEIDFRQPPNTGCVDPNLSIVKGERRFVQMGEKFCTHELKPVQLHLLGMLCIFGFHPDILIAHVTSSSRKYSPSSSAMNALSSSYGVIFSLRPELNS